MTLKEFCKACEGRITETTINLVGTSHVELSRKGRSIIIEKLAGGRWGVSASVASRELVGGPEETYPDEDNAVARAAEILTNGE
jgi:hypothetical protein